MDEKKDVMMFGNKKQMIRTNLLLEAGVCTIIAGVITLAIGGRRFYKQVGAVGSDNSKSTVINDIYEEMKCFSKK